MPDERDTDAALMMRVYTENYLSSVANLGSPGGDTIPNTVVLTIPSGTPTDVIVGPV